MQTPWGHLWPNLEKRRQFESGVSLCEIIPKCTFFRWHFLVQPLELSEEALHVGPVEQDAAPPLPALLYDLEEVTVVGVDAELH